VRCLHRFKERERKEQDKKDELTSCPRLLEDYNVVQEREHVKHEREVEEGNACGSWGKTIAAVFVGRMGNDVVGEGNASQKSVGSWRSGWSSLWST
jgi:hypothetical protein